MATFLKNINLVSRASTQFLEERLGDGEIKGYLCKYILTVCNNAGLPQERIAKLMFVNKSNVTRQLAYLEQHGYVERRQSGEDRRVYLVYPAPKALALLPKIRAANAEWRELITRGFTAEEKEALLALTDRLYANAADYLGGKILP